MNKTLRKFVIISSIACSLCACGPSLDDLDPSIASQEFPAITQVVPTSGRPGDIITIFGLGFSVVPQENIVIIGNKTALASEYELVNNENGTEVEKITFEIPVNTTTGVGSVSVLAITYGSNSIEFTILP